MTNQVETKQVTWQEMEVSEEQCQGCFDPQCGEESAVRGILLVTGLTSEEFQKAFENYYLDEASKGNVFAHVPVISSNPSDVAFSIPGDNVQDVQHLAEGESEVELHTYTSMGMRFGAALCTAHRAPISGRWNLP